MGFARGAVLAALAAGLVPAGPAAAETLVLIGTQSSGPDGGIFAATLDPATGALAPQGLAAALDRPTWLAADGAGRRVYAVSETGDAHGTPGGVYALALDRGSGRLTLLGRRSSGGGGPAHLALAPARHALLVANYGTGHVAAIGLDADGGFAGTAAVAEDRGSGPSPRQQGPHAHGAVPDPSGRYVLAPDLGADRIFVYRLDQDRDGAPRLVLASAAAVAPGSGPRHLAFSRDGRFAFVMAELTAELLSFRWDPAAGTLAPLGHQALDGPDFAGTHSGAEVAVSPDGRFLYASNRGANLLQLFAIDRASGALTAIQRIDCGGRTPWSFAVDPSGRWLVAADQGTSNLASFAVDRRTGRLTATGHVLAVPHPTALVFVR